MGREIEPELCGNCLKPYSEHLPDLKCIGKNGICSWFPKRIADALKRQQGMKAAATILAEKLQTVFVVIEYNWKRVGGAFSTREEAEKWVSHASDIQVNLEWEIHEFKRGCGLTDAEVIAEYEDR